jgi:hypothetical protein
MECLQVLRGPMIFMAATNMNDLKSEGEPQVLPPKFASKPARKQKPFTARGSQDFTELLARLLEAKAPVVPITIPAPCPLIGCTEDFSTIKEHVAAIRQQLAIFLGNGSEAGLFQKLEKKVEDDSKRISRGERWGCALFGGLTVLNIGLQLGIHHFWK